MDTKIYLLPIQKASEKDESYHARYFPDRLQRAKSFSLEDVRLRCLAGSILLHEVLGLEESQVQIQPGGKPVAPGFGREFNLSHSGEYAVLAVSEFPVGVDVELCSLRHVKAARKAYTDAELQWMNEDAENRFTLLWTMKESVSKVFGLGLRMKFSDFDVLPLLRGDALSIRGKTLYGKTLPLPGYSLSVCAAGELGEVSVHEL